MAEENILSRNIPEDMGVSSASILKFIEDVEKKNLELHSFMLLRHGSVAAEGWWSPYGPERPHMLFSLSKSFTSTAVGLAVHEGLLSVDDPVVSFFPEEVPEEVGQNLSEMRVKHLLSMSTGHDKDTVESLFTRGDGNWVKQFLSIPVDYMPGTRFLYNSGATYMLSAIMQKITGQALLQYLTPRLFEPLGIEEPTWETCPMGINTGGWGLSIKTEDIASFGQLYLQKGMWNGKRVVPEEWVEDATSFHISNGDDPDSDWAQGYGYQFWRCCHGAYRGDGAFGQYCIVMPDKDAVVAITSGLGDMQPVLNLIWEHLLPAMGDETLPGNSEAHAALVKKLSTLEYLPKKVDTYSHTLERVSGRRYAIKENEMGIMALSLEFQKDECTFTMWDRRKKHTIRCGMGEWLIGETGVMGSTTPVAASGTWTDENTFMMTWRFIETPFYDTVTFRFGDDGIRVESNVNVSFGPKERLPLEGVPYNEKEIDL